MIRQPFSDETKPFRENKIANGTILEAVDYDLGTNGHAYYDLDSGNYYISTGRESAGNRGRMYRNDGVDIYSDSSDKGRYYVGHIEDGEWLQYSVDVPVAGKYDIVLSVSSADGNGIVSLSDGLSALSGNIKKREPVINSGKN